MQITPKSIFHNYSDPNFLINQNLQCCTSYSDYGTAAAEEITPYTFRQRHFLNAFLCSCFETWNKYIWWQIGRKREKTKRKGDQKRPCFSLNFQIKIFLQRKYFSPAKTVKTKAHLYPSHFSRRPCWCRTCCRRRWRALWTRRCRWRPPSASWSRSCTPPRPPRPHAATWASKIFVSHTKYFYRLLGCGVRRGGFNYFLIKPRCHLVVCETLKPNWFLYWSSIFFSSVDLPAPEGPHSTRGLGPGFTIMSTRKYLNLQKIFESAKWFGKSKNIAWGKYFNSSD